MRGSVLVVVSAVLVLAFMTGVWFTSQALRQDYHVLSDPNNDTERPDLDLSATHVVWLEQDDSGLGRVVGYDLAAKRATVLADGNVSLAQPVATWDDEAAWVEGAGPFAVKVHDFARNVTLTVGGPLDNLTLPGRTGEGDALLVAGEHAGVRGLWRVSLPDGVVAPAPLPAPVAPRMRLSGGRVWWSTGDALHALRLADGTNLTVPAERGNVTLFDVDGDLVAWSEIRPSEGGVFRAVWANVGNGSRGDVSALAGFQRAPAVNGTRVLFQQDDGLVRYVDLATGYQKVLPARDQENIHLHLGTDIAVWLSGTLQGHNVLMVPLASALQGPSAGTATPPEGEGA